MISKNIKCQNQLFFKHALNTSFYKDAKFDWKNSKCKPPFPLPCLEIVTYHLQILDQGMEYGFKFIIIWFYQSSSFVNISSILQKISKFKLHLKNYPFKPFSHLHKNYLFSFCSHGSQFLVSKCWRHVRKWIPISHITSKIHASTWGWGLVKGFPLARMGSCFGLWKWRWCEHPCSHGPHFLGVKIKSHVNSMKMRWTWEIFHMGPTLKHQKCQVGVNN